MSDTWIAFASGWVTGVIATTVAYWRMNHRG